MLEDLVEIVIIKWVPMCINGICSYRVDRGARLGYTLVTGVSSVKFPCQTAVVSPCSTFQELSRPRIPGQEREFAQRKKFEQVSDLALWCHVSLG